MMGHSRDSLGENPGVQSREEPLARPPLPEGLSAPHHLLQEAGGEVLRVIAPHALQCQAQVAVSHVLGAPHWPAVLIAGAPLLQEAKSLHHTA